MVSDPEDVNSTVWIGSWDHSLLSLDRHTGEVLGKFVFWTMVRSTPAVVTDERSGNERLFLSVGISLVGPVQSSKSFYAL
jgi:hypothetical protein